MQISRDRIRQALAHENGNCRATHGGCDCPRIPPAILDAYRTPGGRLLLGTANRHREQEASFYESLARLRGLPARGRGGPRRPITDYGATMTPDEELHIRFATLHEAGHATVCLDRGVRVSRLVVNSDGTGYCQHARCAPLDEQRICLAGLAAIYGNTSLLTLYYQRADNGSSSDFEALLRILRLNVNLAQARACGLPLRYGIKLECDFADEQLISNREEEFDFVRQLLAEHDDFVLTVSHALFERRELRGEELENLWSRHVAGRL